ncbi:hypothetical protein BD626DRAFT_563794 [Schizophyllum amplum]|uniref:Uncharacterized protein n=1 Tax=Schizophyllum amplum TaxID=97359 RepID=A0A550CZA2_9AGAR|nr:hypothetical protein BD626DRAFT_563794 [Auriculariopsis ampla]
MKFTLIAAVAALLLVTIVGSSPVRVFGAARAIQGKAEDVSERSTDTLTNAQRLARGLPPMKPRFLTGPTAVKRQAPSNMRRRDDPTVVKRQAPSNMRRAPGRVTYRSESDRYSGVYAS